MKRLAAVLAVAAAFSGVAPVSAIASGGGGGSCTKLPGWLIPLC